MDVLRTPDDRFADLPHFPFAPHDVEVDEDDKGRDLAGVVVDVVNGGGRLRGDG